MPWNDDLAQNSPAYGIAADESTRIRTIAGPGTGKSFSMRRRVARLIESGVLPGRILAITFTRIAAEDIGRELHALDVDGADQVDARTLHSLAMSILRRQHVIQALGRHTRPMGQFQVQPLLHDLSPNFGTKNRREERVGEYEAAFALNQDDDPLDCEDESDADFRNHLVAWLRFHKAMLIGELVPFLYAYLRDNPSAPELTEYDHILVDEYQDLNKVEQGCIELLGTHANVMIVGDDNQSIYSFKHAHPEGIAQWANNHEDLTDHALDHCYRCPRKIVS
ncbi:MAG: UvrD-helicase domain-containing protein, partial [Cucumibacter sp.]